MVNSADYIFVYGTLRFGTGHPIAELLASQAKYVGRATTFGRLFDLGRYPGMIVDTDLTQKVSGDVFEFSDVERTLAILDDYEGCSPKDVKPSYFRRIVGVANLDCGKQLDAWMYVYNRSTSGLRVIESGEYQAHDLHDFDWRKS